MMPAFAAWMPSPKPGATTSSVVSASEAISTSACPTPTVSTSTTSQPRRVEHPQRLRHGGRQPAELAARGHRADEHALVGGVVLHPHPVAEQRAAGERRGRVDRQHADPLARRPQRGDERRRRRRLADAGRPGEPDDLRVPAVAGRARPRPRAARASRSRRARSAGRPRATGRRVARSTRSATSASRRETATRRQAGDVQDQRVALAAAAAQRRRAGAAAAALAARARARARAGRRTCRSGGRARSRRR